MQATDSHIKQERQQQSLKSAPHFTPNTFRGTPLYDYIEPKCFPEVLKAVRDVLSAFEGQAERAVLFPLVESFMGSGKSTIGGEVSRRFAQGLKAEAKHNYTGSVTCYLESAGLLGQFKEEDITNERRCREVALDAVISALLDDLSVKAKYERNAEDFSVKLLDEFHTNIVVLHVDEYQRNRIAVKMLWKGCALLALGKMPIYVIPIVTGLFTVDGRAVPEGSRFKIKLFNMLSLPEPDIVWNVFCKALKLENKDGGHEPANLWNLLNDCGGHAYSVTLLVEIVKQLDTDTKNLMKTGVLEPNVAEQIFDELLRALDKLYGESVWYAHFSGAEKKTMSLQTKTILTKLLTIAVGGIDIRRTDSIGVRDGVSIQYETMEQYGLFNLVSTEGSMQSCKVYMPFLAVASMNLFLKAIPGSVLSNPFRYGAKIHEELAVVSLYTKVRAFAFYRGAGETATLRELRPDVEMTDEVGDMKIVLPDPEKCRIKQLGSFFEHGPVQLGPSASSGNLQADEGLFAVAADGQKAIDGIAVLMMVTSQLLLILSQSKWAQLFYPGSTSPSKSTVTTSVSEDWVSAMEEMQPLVIQNCFGNGSKPGIVIYDVFSDRQQGARLQIPDTYCMVTTKKSIESGSIGSNLAVRARLKRDITAVNNTTAKTDIKKLESEKSE